MKEKIQESEGHVEGYNEALNSGCTLLQTMPAKLEADTELCEGEGRPEGKPKQGIFC
jgi:hypothetical protein